MAEGGRDHRTSWVPWLALLVSLGSLAVAFHDGRTAHDDRTRDRTLAVSAQVRNVSACQGTYGEESDARAGQVLEYRARVLNTGNVTARDVSVSVLMPDEAGGHLVAGSCRVVKPDAGEARCQDGMDERELRVTTLVPDQALEVRFQVAVDPPPCDLFEARSTFTAHAADRAGQTQDVSGFVARDRDDGLQCGTSDATLMALVPAAYREGCELGQENSNFSDALAHVRCAPGNEVDDLHFFLFADAMAAQQAWQRRLEGIDWESRRQCANDEDGEGGLAYTGRSQPEVFYFCWQQTAAEGAGSWIEIYNSRYKLYIYAHRADQNAVALFDWVNDNTP